MNLRKLANSVTQNVNPNQIVTWQPSSGSYTTAADGTRTPARGSSSVEVQIQPVSGSDLALVDSLNIQGVLRTVYIYGNAQGIVRVDTLGGDLFVFPEIPGGTDRTWKVNQVMETWPDWSKVVVTLQN